MWDLLLPLQQRSSSVNLRLMRDLLPGLLEPQRDIDMVCIAFENGACVDVAADYSTTRSSAQTDSAVFRHRTR